MKRQLLGAVSFCSQCGCRLLLQGYMEDHRLSRIMQQRHICFECAYWGEMKEYFPKHYEVMGNMVLKIIPEVTEKDPTILLGGKGKIRYFVRTSDNTLFKSNDIWLIGTIPGRFKDNFKPTVIEVNGYCYKRLLTFKRKCKSKACFSRYRCFRYDLSIEVKNGPYNKIPKFWDFNRSYCKFFMDNTDPQLIIATSSN